MSRSATGQLDLLDMLAAEQAKLPAPCLFGSPARGLPARAAEFDAWQTAHGSFGSIPRSHAWTLCCTSPKTPTDRCQPTILDADVRKRDRWNPRPEPECGCTRLDALLYRGACTGCTWEGEPCGGENEAVEDACDHAWPGWRDLPAVQPRPAYGGSGASKKDREALARWIGRVNAVYPPGWLEGGGPIRTVRGGVRGLRHVPQSTGFGGYDMAIAPEAAA